MRLPVLLICLALEGVVAPAVTAPAVPHALASRKTVAVLAFDNNTGDAQYDHLGKGMATMMTTDLSSVDDIQLLERERLADVTKEIDAQHSSYFDSTTAVKVGRLAGAQFIVTGAFVAVQPQIRIDTRVIRVETGAIVKTAKVTGKEDDFFELQQRLARQLVKDLDVALTPEGEAKLDARQRANRVDDLDAVVGMSNAISLSDAGDYAGALTRMAPVVAKYPNSVVVKVTYAEMKRRAASSTKDKAKSKLNGLIKRRWP
ncbi:MAG: CsgG/HfaB family protein [Gemmatimonadota bacterium]